MTMIPTAQTSPAVGRFRIGSSSTLALLRMWVDRTTAALVLLATCIAWGRPVDMPVLALAAIVFALVPSSGQSLAQRPPVQMHRFAASWALIVALLLVIGLTTGTLGLYDQHVVATWIVLTPVAQIGVHWALPWMLPRLMSLRREQRAIVVGANRLGKALARSMGADPLSQTRVVGFFDDRTPKRIGALHDAPLLGSVDDVAAFANGQGVHHIYIALPMASQPRILSLLDGLRDTTASVFFVPDIFMLDLIQARIDTVGGLPVLAVCETPFHGTQEAVKRVSDVCIASVAILLTAPLMLAIALAIKLTMPGAPVIFRQRRFGLDGEEIQVWKFRSMRVAEDGAHVRQATRNDDRITPLGRFIRRTSLDELPQFFNVLQGRMSVVGPRPHAVAHNQLYRRLIKGYMIRHKVKPGITGLAQVSGARGETDTVEKMERRIRYDLEYLRNWSLKLDLQIIARTFVQVFRDPDAY